jgi:hypothetical protein
MASDSDHPRRRLSLRGKIILAFAAFFVVLAAVGVGLYFLSANDELTRSVRDIFLILLALEFMVVGVAMVVMIIQLSRLLLLLEMEIRPMLENATDTLDTLRGTSLFLSENLVEPVIQLRSSLAGIQRVLEVLGVFRRSS